MSTPHKPGDDPDVRLAELLADAVSDVEPGNRLDEIRDRTKVVPMSARRPWLFAAGGAVVATAAVVTAVALLGAGPFEEAADPGPAEQTSEGPREPKPTKGGDTEPTSPTEPTDPTDPSEPTATAEPPSGGPVPVYFVSETPQGLRLFREFQSSGGEDPLLAAAARTVEGGNLDPDYRSLWPAGSSVASVQSDGGDVLTVDVTGAPRELPAGMSDEDAQLAIQQVVYSTQAAYGQGRVGVQLLLDGQRTDMVLGQPASEPLANAPVLETLSLMQITYPNEGDTVSGTFTAEGVSNSFEANVVWRIVDGSNTVVAEDFTTAEGWMGDQLFPWSTKIDVSDLEPGAYTFEASTDDPSGGAEGAGPHVDTRTIFVE